MSDLSGQLADLFKAGLQSRPDLREPLVAAITAHLQDPQGSMTKAEANYRPSDNENEVCAHCTHFKGTGACDIVAGSISPHDVCDHFEAGTPDPYQSEADTTAKQPVGA